MSRVRVKVCGITSAADAHLAAAAGADAVGFVFAASPRQISPEEARAIRRSLPPFVSAIGVFVNESPERVVAIAREVGLSAVQLHGDETSAEVAAVARFVPVIKALRVRDRASVMAAAAYPDAHGYLFDAYAPGAYGGTGTRFNWDLLAPESGLSPPRPWVLAGGLTPENVEEAIRRCRPYAVDVSSGVEASPGRKAPEKVREFIQRVRRVDIE